MRKLKVKWSILLLDSCPIEESILEELHGGYEAATYKLSLNKTTYTLKVWSKQAKVNSEVQYHLLNTLFEAGVAVSQVFGWGVDAENNPVLLTSFDGEPIRKLNKAILNTLVEQLLLVHQLDEATKQKLALPQHDFVTYFFPRLTEYDDLKLALEQLLSQTQLSTNSVIHGDYNLGNIVVNEQHYTIIDWTNGQLGEARYDIAWSIILMQVFVNERLAEQDRKLFLAKTNYTKEELQLFEAIASIRLIVLIRNSYISLQPDQLSRLQDIMSQNPCLAKLQLTI